jgi:hypothetical protein
MVLDNWGEVKTWTATAPVTSHGPSGIGFVNLGQIDRLVVQASIETFGTGARGFNLYDGTLRHASSESIATHGDGSVGVQVSKPLPNLEISGDLTTDGGEGQSLVKGVQVSLKAIALSIKPGADVGAIRVGGQVRTAGDNVISVEIDGDVGQIDSPESSSPTETTPTPSTPAATSRPQRRVHPHRQRTGHGPHRLSNARRNRRRRLIARRRAPRIATPAAAFGRAGAARRERRLGDAATALRRQTQQ